MKKIPLMLSGLALVAANTNLMPSSWAIGGDDRGQATMSYTLGETGRLSIGDDIRIDHATTNIEEHQQQVMISRISTAQNNLTFEFNDLDSGWRPQKIVVSQRDYENGVTEVMADEKFQDLTDSDTDWDVRLVTLAVTDDSPVQMVGVERPHKLVDNRTDILYYAVQFEKEGGIYWLRGKLNYRRCIHAPVYESTSMSCYLMMDDETQTLEYFPVNASSQTLPLPATDEVITWEEEWREILSQRVGDLQVSLQRLKDDLLNAETILVDAGIDIGQLEKVVNTTTNPTSFLMEVQNLQMLLTEAQRAYDDLANENTCPVDIENEKLRQEIAAIEARLADMESECQLLRTELEVKEEEIMVLRQETERLVAENSQLLMDKEQLAAENDAMRRKIAELEAEQGKTQDETDTTDSDDMTGNDFLNTTPENGISDASEGLLTPSESSDAVGQPSDMDVAQGTRKISQVAQNDLNQGRVRVNSDPEGVEEAISDNKQGEGVITLENGTEIEVPNLGETEVRINFWWVLVTLIGLFGAITMWLRRVLGGRFKNKH